MGFRWIAIHRIGWAPEFRAGAGACPYDSSSPGRHKAGPYISNRNFLNLIFARGTGFAASEDIVGAVAAIAACLSEVAMVISKTIGI